MHSLSNHKVQALALGTAMMMTLCGCSAPKSLVNNTERSLVNHKNAHNTFKNKAHKAFENSAQSASQSAPIRMGAYEIFDPSVLSILDTSAKINTLATGFEWVEGPVWWEEDQALLFSDIPTHKVYRYKDGQGVSEFISHSGFSNGLLINAQNELVLMQSRSRQIAKWRGSLIASGAEQAAPRAKSHKLKQPAKAQKPHERQQTFPADDYIILTRHYQGQMLNSPNDGVFKAQRSTKHSTEGNSKGGVQGTLYFTDPPYGLPKQLDDPAKELDFQGVYALSPKGELTLLDKTLVYPNGIALAPDEKTLYVAASNPKKPAWYAYSIDDEGGVHNRKLFHQAPVQSDASHGLPDGLKVHRSGIVFATGPSGIWLFDPQGTLLAKVHMPSISANLAFNADQTRVFVTAHHQLLSFSLKP
ncbi:SMP-30/gluconolactonase/LRE family protein [Paraglaciecola sp. T6c]|uniref:SMP-30/gluconolactonase/LRE family protein n=1 Tax=Pseudoalteromonas atlantica (strain T6c / ATCC BAA-1087) TaxID=3042615 RepID=UPI00005C6A21|nr:SMP-30/gluconolactonase/LRE family protein [Paraglaciecola sp. T6c]